MTTFCIVTGDVNKGIAIVKAEIMKDLALKILETLGESREEREASRTLHAGMKPFCGFRGPTPDSVPRQSYARVVESRDDRKTGVRFPA
jgi:hypothetical protein